MTIVGQEKLPAHFSVTAARNGDVSRPDYTQWLNEPDATNSPGSSDEISDTAGVRIESDTAFISKEGDIVTEVVYSTYLPSVNYSTDSFTQEVS